MLGFASLNTNLHPNFGQPIKGMGVIVTHTTLISGKYALEYGRLSPNFPTQMSNPSELRHVLVIEDQKSRRIVHLVDNRYDIGRDPQSTIPLFDRQSSRHHATLVRVNDYVNNCHSYRLIDGNLQGQKSRNGLLVNGRRTPSHELKHGDCIQFSHQAKASYHLIATAADLVSLQAQYPLRYSSPPSELRSPPAEQADMVVPPDFAPFSEDEENAAFLPIVPNDQAPIQRAQPPSSGESSPYPLIELDLSGRVIYLNSAASTTFPNLSQAKLDHPLLKDLVHPSQPREGPSFVREVQVDQAFFEQHIYYFPDSGIIRCYMQDITRYHNLLQRYKRSKERSILFDRQGTEGIFLVSTNYKQVIETNQVFCDFVGYRAKDLLTMDLYQLMTLVDRDTIDRELETVTPDLPLLLEESFYRRQDGSLVGFSVKVNQVVYLERAVYCFVAQAIRDRKT